MLSTALDTAPTQAQENLRGVVAMVVAVAAFCFMDAGLKTLSPHYPAVQITAVRAIAGLPITIAWIWSTGSVGTLWPIRIGLHVMRAVLSVIMLSLFTFGVRELPLSDAYTIFFVAPLLITALAAPFLGERVDRQRWIAIVCGFIGVLVVLRPSGAGLLSTPGLAVLGTALCYAISAIAVRVLGRTDSTQSMVFWLMLMMAIGAGVFAIPVWRPIQSAHWVVIVEIAVTGFVGQWAITEAFKRGEASFVAAFEYTALIWGAGLDWFIWRTFPGPNTLLGAAVVIGSGLYLVRSERRGVP